MKLKTLSQTNVKNKLVLLRIDINSPVVKRKILDNPRFKAISPTIKYLIKKNAKITILAHQGRKGDKDFASLKKHAKLLSKHVGKKIKYINYLFEDKAKDKILSLKPGRAILLKNVRAYKDEDEIKNKKNSYKEFCKLFDIYINDAFSVSHRAQGSIVLPPKYLPSIIGLELEKEIDILEKFMKEKSKNKIFILGGSKVEDYLPLFKFLKDKRNKILAAGVLANLFLTVKGHNLGYESKWLEDNNYLLLIPSLKKIYNKHHNQIILPVDFGLITEKERRLDISLDQAPFKYKICDISNETIKLFKNYLDKASYILIKGPLGFSEIAEFSHPTIEILKYISNLTRKNNILSLIGGGHLTTTIEKYHIPNNFSHISTAGGALIKYLSGEKLPGLKALEKNKE